MKTDSDGPEGAPLAANGEQQAQSLLEQLDKRQDDVLAQLDDLNLRIETLITEWTRKRQEESDDQSDPQNEVQTALDETKPVPTRSAA